MKKLINLTLGLLGISTISAITVGSVISCSNNNTNLVSNNNQDNKNSNNKSSSTNPNSSNDTSFIPYSELTKTVTKEPSFAAALANWTNRWKQLTSNSETYLKMITNDFNACLEQTYYFMKNNPGYFFDQEGPNTISHTVLLNISASNIQIVLNKNNTFNISYDSIINLGYIKNNKSYSNVVTIESEICISNISFSPYIFTTNITNMFSSNNESYKNNDYYGGEYIKSAKFDLYLTRYVINNPQELNDAPNWLIEKSKAFNSTTISKSKPNINSEINNMTASQNECSFIFFPFGSYYVSLISSYQNGINYGELSFANNK